MSPELVGGFLTTGPTGKSCSFFPVVDSSFIALWSEKIFNEICLRVVGSHSGSLAGGFFLSIAGRKFHSAA